MNTRKKTTIITAMILAAAIIVVGGFVLYMTKKNDEGSSQEDKKRKQVILKSACELFDMDAAKSILGDSVKQTDSNTVAKQKKTNNSTAVTSSSEVKTDTKPEDGITSRITASGTEDPAQPKASACSYVKQNKEEWVVVTVLPADEKTSRDSYNAIATSDGEKVGGFNGDSYWRTGKDMAGKDFAQLAVMEPGGLVSVSSGSNDLELMKRIANTIEDNLND